MFESYRWDNILYIGIFNGYGSRFLYISQKGSSCFNKVTRTINEAEEEEKNAQCNRPT